MTPLALDHVAFGVRNVGAIAESFGRIGFTATAPSRCAWDQGDGPMTSSSVSVMFAEQYLDFVEIDHPRWLEHLERSPLYGGRAAPSGIVLRGFTKEEIRARGASYTITRTLEGASPSPIWSMRPISSPRREGRASKSWVPRLDAKSFGCCETYWTSAWRVRHQKPPGSYRQPVRSCPRIIVC